MAANKFATMLHRNANRITVVLVYTLLEWILIILLLLNSLFSYLISKFASFFGLQPPCLWCSRLDHLIEAQKSAFSYRSLVCETHAAEISKLGYCSNHRRLAEACDMCEDCSSSRPSHGAAEKRIAVFSLVSGDEPPNAEIGSEDLKCSCCGVALDEGLYSPYLVLKPSWDVLDYPHKGNLIKGVEEMNSDDFNDVKYLDPPKPDNLRDLEEDEIRKSVECGENQSLSDVSVDERLEGKEEVAEVDDEEGDTANTEQNILKDCLTSPSEGTATRKCCGNDGSLIQLYCIEDQSPEMLSPKFERRSSEDRIFPIEIIDSLTEKCESFSRIFSEVDTMLDHPEGAGITESQPRNVDMPLLETIVIGREQNAAEELQSVQQNGLSPFFPQMESAGGLIKDEFHGRSEDEEAGDLHKLEAVNTAKELETVEQNDSSSIFPPKEPIKTVIGKEFAGIREQGEAGDLREIQAVVKDSEDQPDEDKGELCAESRCDNVLGNEVDDGEQAIVSAAALHEDLSLCDGQNDHVHQEKDEVKTRGSCRLISQPAAESEAVERGEAEDEKAPETPTYLENFHSLHKRLLFERKESGAESLDGSVISDIDCGEVTVDRLKSALRAERKALGALYAELEEERSASAIAANQTMAMITRLQEEKAAMQMEALQYQRMMEEQAEYDQEALQLLNELMVKREKEKQELEKELELYRKKVVHYEAKEKRMMNKKANGVKRTSSTSSSLEDSDVVSIELNEGDESFFGLIQESAQNTPAEEVLSSTQESANHLNVLEESLADFEEERLSILEQLKALEEKLFTLDIEEEHFEDVKPVEELRENGEVSGHGFEIFSPEGNGLPNGFSHDTVMNAKHHQERRPIGSKGKQLLPLFDAISMKDEEGPHDQELEANGISEISAIKIANDERKLAIEEEVDHVYERLQALEADREFLKHCINSLKKGDKGMDLLQEILQHLRDLRTVELRVRNSGDPLS